MFVNLLVKKLFSIFRLFFYQRNSIGLKRILQKRRGTRLNSSTAHINLVFLIKSNEQPRKGVLFGILSSFSRVFYIPFSLSLLLAVPNYSFAIGQQTAKDETEVWLEKMASALKNTYYQGYFLFENHERLQTFQVSHSISDAAVCERIVSRDGPYQEMIRKGDKVAYINDSDAPNYLLKKIQYFTPLDSDFESLRNSYTLKMVGERRISERPTKYIEITPKDKYRYALKLWIDRETGLPVKWVTFGLNDKFIERFQFTQLNTSPEAVNFDCTLPEGYHWVENYSRGQLKYSRKLSFPWQIQWKPSGFKEMYSEKNDVLGDRRLSADVAFYSDMLSSFSVLVENIPTISSYRKIREQIGATALVSSTFDNNEGQTFMVTVVGELPIQTLDKIASSVVASAQ